MINTHLIPQDEVDNFVVQDFGIPSKYLKESVEFFDDTVGIYPLWLCPARALDTGENSS